MDSALKKVEIVVISSTTEQVITASSDSKKDDLEQLDPIPQLPTPITWGNRSSPGMNTIKYCPSPSSHRSFRTTAAAASPTSENLRRRSVARSAFQKPKTRFAEPFAKVDEETTTTATATATATTQVVQQQDQNIPSTISPLKLSPIRKKVEGEGAGIATSPKTPLLTSPRGEKEEEEEEEIEYTEKIYMPKMGKWRKKLNVFRWIEWIVFFCIKGFLLACLTVTNLEDIVVWELQIWKWSVLVMVVVSGRLMTKVVMSVLLFFIERQFLLRKKVVYFIYSVRKTFQVFLWLVLLLLTWVLLINRGVKRSQHTAEILNYVSRALVCLLIGSVIWMGKIILVKLLASSFFVGQFFDRIQESIFHQYILKTLSGPPLIEMAEMAGNTPQLSFHIKKKERQQEVLGVASLSRLKQSNVSAWTMKALINIVTTSGFSIYRNGLESFEDEEEELKQITNEGEAVAAAKHIFKNVSKPDSKYIEEEDLFRFLNASETNVVLPLFVGAAETGKIKKSALRDWVVMVYHDRKSLSHSLKDIRIAVKQLSHIITAIVVLVIIIVWLLILKIGAIQVFVFTLCLTLVISFMFGNTAKTVFRSIIFVFVRHPFDVGDRCVIDGVQMVVEEMYLLTTVFLRYDQEKIDYPNSVLAAKPISNFYRSPDMGDALDFSIDVSTSVETIGALKARIKMYIESRPIHWNYRHLVEVKGIEDLNRMKMTLYIHHTMNYQNFWVRCERRSELVIEMKKIFEELSIKCHLLPQEVHLNYVGSAATLLTSVGH